MTNVHDMEMTWSDIRRFAAGRDVSAAVELIEAHLIDPNFSQNDLVRVCPLSDDDAEYIISLRAVTTDWDSVPERDDVDYSGGDDPAQALMVAYEQLLRHSCERIVSLVETGD